MNNISLQFSRHETALRRFAITFTKDNEDANDLVQDTFLKAIRCAHQYQEGSSLRGWLYTIMKNTFINQYRRRSKYKSIIYTVEDLLPNQLLNGAESNLGVNHFIGEDINKALNKLPLDCMVPFVKYFEGYKYHEIAAELNIPIGTVKTRIHLARQSLKRNLKIYNLIN